MTMTLVLVVSCQKMNPSKLIPTLQRCLSPIRNIPKEHSLVAPSNVLPTRPFCSGNPSESTIYETLAVQALINSYQTRGHLSAKLDPLELMGNSTIDGEFILDEHVIDPRIVLKRYRLENNLDTVYTLPQNTFIGGKERQLPLREIIKRLEKVYCGSIGVECGHLDDVQASRFIRERMELPGAMEHSAELKKRTLTRLIHTIGFENFVQTRWSSAKRFGIEGCDMFIPMMRQIVDRSTELGVEHFFVGIAHRGRLNLFANVFHKPLHSIFNQFVPLPADQLGCGDVKYHYGCHVQRVNTYSKKHYKLTLLANPGHLEAVNALVLGRTRAEQVFAKDREGFRNMAICIHGDAAFAGQGVNFESYGLTWCPDYTTRGCIGFIINNQVGFTTDPRYVSTSRYCSDLGGVVHAPIFHVNADDPDSAIHVCNVAAEYRAKFQRDVIIDLIGYRRHGHTDVDDPMFTQPFMYKRIKQIISVDQKYKRQLLTENVVTIEEIKDIENQYRKRCEEAFAEAEKKTQFHMSDWVDSDWSSFYANRDPLKTSPTGIPEDVIVHIATKFSSPPPEHLDFVIHKGLDVILKHRQELVKQRTIDWAIAEALAFGSLLKDGIHVRLSGQDVERGTFAQRHHVLHHQQVDKVIYKQLNNLYPDQAEYNVCNSTLSEYGILGFEMGYSLASPNSLVVWEAQFGELFNVAQCIFDQFLSAGETKWGRQNGLVCFLPHGYEGMGPEHSSARVERFLQCCNDDPHKIPPLTPDTPMTQLKQCNWIIANCSTPANFFHLLRRQIALPFRKPLIIFTPKSLLKLKECRSPFEDFLPGTEFKRLIPEAGAASKDPNVVKKLMFCSGKAYYDIKAAVKLKNIDNQVAVATVEQLSPFPYDLIKQECEKYKNAKIVWAQEEPKNMGAYSYVCERMRTLLGETRKIEYVGRPVATSPATGHRAKHLAEVKDLEEQYSAL